MPNAKPQYDLKKIGLVLFLGIALIAGAIVGYKYIVDDYLPSKEREKVQAERAAKESERVGFRDRKIKECIDGLMADFDRSWSNYCMLYNINMDGMGCELSEFHKGQIFMTHQDRVEKCYMTNWNIQLDEMIGDE